MNIPERGGLSVDATFIVQLRSDSDIKREHLSGRVEHLVSGHSEPFGSLAALLNFMARFAAADSQEALTPAAEPGGENT